ncbi:MAG: hypothetical protein IAE64_02700 [Flavobacteriales bacterium]|nr:MAG: hypothetical protein F9K28_06790 [Bacteroidota bacterium]MBE2265141.1 hypothetical protein [Flavobacteriales bacterium]MBW7852629.1 hypothetical protein [Candidatus Kapabacteria bacterium]MCC6331111.1 hypothetical protein [Ignavibacteria bacterium]NOG67809.1 hypothetical protein [Chlorobiota bacterium]
MKSIITFSILVCFMITAGISTFAGDAEEFAKCPVQVNWKRTKAEDYTVTVTVTNGSSYTLIDPKVRVVFYDKDGKELSSAAKAYFARIPKGKSKRMEARIFSYIDTNSVDAKGFVEEGTLK